MPWRSMGQFAEAEKRLKRFVMQSLLASSRKRGQLVANATLLGLKAGK